VCRLCLCGILIKKTFAAFAGGERVTSGLSAEIGGRDPLTSQPNISQLLKQTVLGGELPTTAEIML
jgi:hypothetical protein